MENIQKVKGFSTFDLKIIGIVLMVVDHVHEMFAPVGAPTWLDWFGRPVATIFFFTSVIGFTSSIVKLSATLMAYSYNWSRKLNQLWHNIRWTTIA
ncbi:MAG TPA: hypothetical protein H9869_07355 [Candidatus Ligilactobacillus excrementipullorum]|nr:hypothetical protein [Candidatus Ligilactobacillus excrementipullorum]